MKAEAVSLQTNLHSKLERPKQAICILRVLPYLPVDTHTYVEEVILSTWGASQIISMENSSQTVIQAQGDLITRICSSCH